MMKLLGRFLFQLAHPIQSLYRHLLYRRNIHIVSQPILTNLYQQLEKGEQKTKQTLTEEERNIVTSIQQRTDQFNRNNITRTHAYFTFFQRCPEVHWAFLAHVVSRNGGWNMTDLKGSVIPSIIPNEQREPLFLFLERANALIFHDAYPQLLLYEESKRRKKKLFDLLPFFSVSSFMKPFWDYFYETKHAPLLTVALIINEQQYIQQRVIEDVFFQQHVLATFPFLCQQWLGFNDVLIPYERNKDIRLAGMTVRDFVDVHHRIHIGKALYGLLFYKKSFMTRAYRFAARTAHTGSRADFWPHIFSTTKNKETTPIYSPRLEDAWPTIIHRFPDHRDWFTDPSIIKEVETIPLIIDEDMTSHYWSNIQKLHAMSTVTN
jgi:hypothetical protein